MQIPLEIQDLIGNPQETLHLELKRWVNLHEDKVARAKIARHLAALANHGGGYLLFGFQDDGTPDTPHPGDLSQFGRDAIGGIIDRYLSPTFQCEVFFPPRIAGDNAYPVVRVPGHGKVPVCSKRNGPNDSNNNPEGIRAGVYYIRAPGPKSIAIENPTQWQDVIHRCVINEREGLLKSIGKLLGHAEQVPEANEDLLSKWHDQIRERVLEPKSR